LTVKEFLATPIYIYCWNPEDLFFLKPSREKNKRAGEKRKTPGNGRM
jgi:hypothetical protein